MHIDRHDTFYRISLVTGPSHNTLLLEFATDLNVAVPEIEALPPIGACNHGPLDPAIILQSVVTGIETANQELGTNYRITRIRYIANDTPRRHIYTVLSHTLVSRIHKEHL